MKESLTGRQAAFLAKLIDRLGERRSLAVRRQLGLDNTPLLQLTKSEAYNLITELHKAGRR